jgi:glycosyltransferase involved in cell wall biosynthesis
VGGVEVLTARLAHHLIALGHQVEVWTGRSEGDVLPHYETVEGIPVRRFVFAMPRASLASIAGTPAALKTLRELRSVVRDFQPDVLHVQCFSGNGAYAVALSRLTRTPLVITLQGETFMDDHDIYDHSASLRAALRLGLRRALAVTGCSALVLDDAAARFGLEPTRARVIFNGVDAGQVRASRVSTPFQRYVLGVGRLVHKKGLDLLLSAFAAIARLDEDLGLVIAGDGPERGRLQQQAVDLGVDERVFFPGVLTQSEVAGVLQDAEIFVMPSRMEPFGIVVLEAWRAGVPVIATVRGGPPEFVVDGASGLIVDPLSPAALQSAMQSLLSSADLRLRLAHAGRNRISDFTWPTIAGRYSDLYASVVRPLATDT